MQSDPRDGVPAWAGLPTPTREALHALRALIHDAAAALEGTGGVEERLTWGQPTLAARSGRGTSMRLGREKKTDGDYALFFKCRTSIVDVLRECYPGLRFEGHRAVVFRLDEPFPEDAVRGCVRAALTYQDWRTGPSSPHHPLRAR
jgi:hypothetical protein